MVELRDLDADRHYLDPMRDYDLNLQEVEEIAIAWAAVRKAANDGT